MDQQIAATEATPLEKRRADHEAWWKAFWERSWIHAEDTDKKKDDAFVVSRGYALQRFINACGGRARNHHKESRFPAFWGPNYNWIPDQDHGGVVMKAFQSMILQTEGRKIFIAPAWPKDWNANFKLHAPYQTVVEGRVEDGKLVDLKVTPESRGAEVVFSQ